MNEKRDKGRSRLAELGSMRLPAALALALVAALMFGIIALTGSDGARAGVVHTTGYDDFLTCPAKVDIGTTVTCTYQTRNQDVDHGVTIDSITFTVKGETNPLTGCASKLLATDGEKGGGDTTSCSFDYEPTFAQCDTLVNVRVDATGADQDTGDFGGLVVEGVATGATRINCNPDVGVTKTAKDADRKIKNGEDAVFNIEVTNKGNAPADDVTLTDQLPKGGTVSGPDEGDCVIAADKLTCDFRTLDPGETRNITVAVPTTADNCPRLTNKANVTASNEGEGKDGNNNAEAFVDVNCEEVTRTPGFWQTHQDFMIHVFEDHLGSNIDLGWVKLTTHEEVMGMFWANVARESDRSRRDPVCQARIIGSFQLTAAILNTGLGTGGPADPEGGDAIANMQAALAAGDRDEILRLNGILDEFNNSGDDIEIDEDVPPADPRSARSKADITIADC